MNTQKGRLQLQLQKIMKQRYPMMLRGVEEARSIDPGLVDQHFEDCLGWIVRAYGEDALINVVEGYASFTLEVNRAQYAYEKRGTYECSTFDEANARVYQQAEYMQNYYWGVFAILFCWSHYVDLMDLYLNRFVSKLTSGRIIEVAPGHGVWGLLAVKKNQNMFLEGWDISPTSLDMAPRMAAGAGLTEHASYNLGDATQISHDSERYDAGICSFMLEHLEDPGVFLKDLAMTLKSGALAYISLALTAAQTDHIYEFKKESEGILLAEAAGFELLESRVSRPMRSLPGAKRVPRVQAMVLIKK